MALSFIITQQPLNGTLVRVSSTGRYRYIPNAAFIGTDTFKWKASDGVRQSNESTISVEVRNFPLSAFPIFLPTTDITVGDHSLVTVTRATRLRDVQVIVTSAIVTGDGYGVNDHPWIRIEFFKTNAQGQETLLMVAPLQITDANLTVPVSLSIPDIGAGQTVHFRVTSKHGVLKGLRVEFRQQVV